MTYEEHLELAYWSVMQTLHPGDIPVSLLEKLKPSFLNSLSAGSKVAGRILSVGLLDVSWDWPMWHGWAKREGSDSLPGIDARILRMKPAASLESASKADLQTLCEAHGVRVLSRATNQEMINTLRKTLDAAAFAEMARPFGERLRANAHAACREEMAMSVASYVANIANNARHYEQLRAPDFASLRPFWKFVWTDDFVTPRACKKFDGKILPIDEALRVFPHLPCDHLRCSCYLSSVDSR